MPIDLECGENYYVSKTGKLVPVENCSVVGSSAILIFKNGVLTGVTGKTDQATAQKLAKAIGQSKANVQKLTL